MTVESTVVEAAAGEAVAGATSVFSWPWLVGLTLAAVLAVAGLIYAAYSYAYDKGYAKKGAEIALVQKQLEDATRLKVDKANADAAVASALTATKQTELDKANAKFKTASDNLDTANRKLISLSHTYADRARTTKTLATNNGAGPDWIGLFGECVASNQSLASSLGRSTAKLGQVAKDAATWADTINAAQNYIKALPLTNTNLMK